MKYVSLPISEVRPLPFYLAMEDYLAQHMEGEDGDYLFTWQVEPSVIYGRNQAVELAAQSMLGSAKMVLETKKHPEQLRDEVCSPGGTTIVGVKILEDLGLRSAIASAVDGTIAKSREMSQE